jgi:hypothetical protein
VHSLLRRSLATSAAAALFASTACYSYLPLTLADAPATRSLRVYLTTPGGEVVGRSAVGLEPSFPSMLDGLLVRRTDSSVVLSVQSVTRLGRDEETWKGEEVSVPLTAIDHVAVREMDRTKTVFAVAATLAALLVGRSLWTGSEDSVTGARTGGTPTGQ